MTTLAVPRPTPLAVHVNGIPASLRVERRWVVWRYIWKEGKNGKPGKWDKPPYIATAPDTNSKSTDPATWRSFEDAWATYSAGRSDGIGFVLGDGWVGFDADDTHAPEHVQLVNTYTELSPSGTGVHAIMRGSKPGTHCRVDDTYELYDHGRYFTVTGHHVAGTPATVEERTAEIATLYALLFPERQNPPPASSPGNNTSDDPLIAMARAAKNGTKFISLWEGNYTDYPSHSEADMALCNMLAFWTNRDAAQMDRLFRRSGLMRDKWDDKRGNSTYGQGVVAEAIKNTPKGYTEPSSGPTLIIRRASDVPDETTVKIFGGRLVKGSFALVSGPAGMGKGMSITDMAARLTTGEPFPGETATRPPVKMFICTTEDSESTFKSRLRAAGADLDRALFVTGPEVSRGGLIMPSPMMLDNDAGPLVRLAIEHEAKAIFLETTVEHFGDREGKASRRGTHAEADVRAALAPFRALCQMGGLFGLGLIHPRKSTQGGIEDSISGSAAFRNVPRAAHHIYGDPEDESGDVRLFFTSKASYQPRLPSTLRFHIVPWDEERGMPCNCGHPDCGHEGRVEWLEPLIDSRTADKIWQQIAERGKPRRDVVVVEAEEFLSGLMKNGAIDMLPDDIFKMARDEGIAKMAIKRAKKRMKLVSKKEGFPGEVVGWRVVKSGGDGEEM